MECYCYLRNIQDLLSDGKTPYALENILMDQLSLLVHWLSITRFQHETNQDFTNLERRFYQE